MDTLRFAENLIRLRKKRKVTQEELADFIGVTKASVSKWETRQSLPDVLLLPQLASFFGVSVDELLGYAPQLSREQIQKQYYTLAEAFAKQPFETVMEQCQELVKKYYACYPFLFQMTVLLLNHFMLAEGQERQQEILEKALELCRHILEECKDISLCTDTLVLQAQIYLLQRKPNEVVEALEEINSPYRIARQGDGLLIQAYQLAGEKEKAIAYSQISMFLHLLSLMGTALNYLEIQAESWEICEETIRRVDTLEELYGLAHLHPNITALLKLQAAVIYSLHGREEEALERLDAYVAVIEWMLEGENLSRHEDIYFDRIAKWYEDCDLGAKPPRDKKVILGSALQGLDHPAFASLQERPQFQRLKQRLEKKGVF